MRCRPAIAQKSEMTSQKFKDVLQIVLLLFAAAWGVYTFVYKDIILPGKRPPAVTLATTLEELDRSDGMILVRAHLVVANPGDGKVWVPALWWNVYGERFGNEDRTPPKFVGDVRLLLEGVEESLSRFSNVESREVVAVGRIPDYETWYQPRDETVHEQLFLVPEGRFDAVRVFVDAYISRSIAEFAPTTWEIDEAGVLNPTLLLKQKGWAKDSSRVAPLAPATDPAHQKLLDRIDAGHTSTTASLRIKPKASTAEARRQNTNAEQRR